MAIMEETKCSNQPCSLFPTIVCDCQGWPTYLCSDHQEYHMETKIEMNHSLNPIFARFSKAEANTLKKVRRMLLETKETIISRMSYKIKLKIQKITQDYSKHLYSALKNINLLLYRIDQAISTNSALRSSKNQFLNQLIDIPGLRSEEQDYKLKKILYVSTDLSFPWFDQQRFHYVFEHNSRRLLEIDNLKHKKSYIDIQNLAEKVGFYAGTCTLNDGKVFYCGGIPTGYHKEAINSVYIINPRNRKAKKVDSLPSANNRIVPYLLNQSVYVFGGINSQGESMKTAWRYSLRSRYWETLSELRLNSFGISCVSAGLSILIFGYETSGVYEYSYKGCQKILNTPKGPGLICKDNSGKIYVLVDGNLYISDVYTYKMNWNKRKNLYEKSIFNSSLETAPQIFGDSFYFTIKPVKYMRFNFEKLTLNSPLLMPN